MARKKTTKQEGSGGKDIPAAERGSGPLPGGIRVRTARLGDGACVLITVPEDAGGEFNILIDCGAGSSDQAATALTREVVADLGETAGGRIDLLIITSPQPQRLEGFRVAAEEFDRIEIGDLWLAWTEDPGDVLAAEILTERQARIRAARIAAEVCRGEEVRPADPGDGAERDLLESVIARVSGRVRYLRAGERLTLPGVEGLSAFVLGPPRRESPSGRHPTGREGAGASGAAPFDQRFCIEPVAAVELEFFCTTYGFGDSAEDRDKAWRKISSDNPTVPDPVGAMIEAELGESSLALAFQLDRPAGRRRVLLFPSDVPVASWSRWTGLTLERQDAKGKPIGVEELLAQTACLLLGPVASCGSACADSGLELVGGEDLVVIISSALEQVAYPGVGAPTERLWERARGRLIFTGAAALPEPAALNLSPAEQSAFAHSHRLARLYVESDFPL